MAKTVSIKLSDAAIRGITTDKPIERRDHVVRGLYVRISPLKDGTASRTWKLDTFTESGKRKPVTLGTFPDLDCAAARKAARALRDDVDAGEEAILAKDEDPTIGQLIDRYEAHKRHSLKSVDKIAKALRGAFPLDRKVRAVTRPLVLQWQAEIANRTSAANSNRLISYLSGLLGFAVSMELIERNPAAISRANGGIKKLPEPFRPARHFTAEEWAALDATLDRSVPAWMADLCRVAIGTGARLGELLGLPWHAVDLDAGTATFEAATTKDSEPRTVPMSSGACATLKARAERTGTAGLVFADANGNRVTALMDKALEAAGVAKVDTAGKGVSFKTFRTTFASWIVQRTQNLLAASTLLGHSNVAITGKHYAHLLDDDLAAMVRSAIG
jgi:integrase